MSDRLQDVLAAASGTTAGRENVEPLSRRVHKLRAVTPGLLDSLEPVGVPRSAPNDGGFDLGWGGLRVAFWLGGLLEAMAERDVCGEPSSEREASLIVLIERDFAAMRPSVIAMVISRLDEILASPRFDAKLDAPGAKDHAGSFALNTLRNLSKEASRLLQTSGPDEAIALFGAASGKLQPVTIYQLVFDTALDILDSFQRLQPNRSELMQMLAEALESAIERV
jgi:hypothetical protein